MISFDEFEELARNETALLPDYVFEELTGGVLVDASAYLHPGRVADDLYILGTYSSGGITGRQVVLYYGSFMAVMGGAGRERIRQQIRSTLRHEFLHHMETRAGLYWEGTLVEEDREQMRRYYMMHRPKMEEDQGTSSEGR